MRAVVMLAYSVHWGRKWTGSYTTVDLIAAATNALNGALLARRPDHFRGFTVVGIILMALLGGLGGGITRDVLVAKIPSALTNPAYLTLALVFGVVGYLIAYTSGQLFREGLFQFMTSFSLPWYAIVGAYTGVTVGLPVIGCVLLASSARPPAATTSTLPAAYPPSNSSAASGSSHRGAHRARLESSAPGSARPLGVDRDLVRRRIHGPHDRPLPGLGGTAREGAERRLPTLRRTADTRPQARRQVTTRASVSRLVVPPEAGSSAASTGGNGSTGSSPSPKTPG